ncbi:MAG: hypothetical protein JNL32_16875, partial [Candidatus Kapabacteria bacterium]|nr:hypothetical protein [Candidatus Kapabacteria bacterium]
LFITLISRIFIELGDVVVGLILDGVTANTFALIVLASAEIWAVLQLWKVIKPNPYANKRATGKKRFFNSGAELQN